jgi:hypothetical protein
MGIQADYAAISADSAKLATDQASLVALQALIAGDTTTSTAADSTLSADLQPLKRPVFVSNSDGTVAVLAFASTPPGYTITIADPAS